MSFLVLSISFTVTLVLGATIATQQGYIFYNFRKKLEDKVKDNTVFSWYDTLLLCVYCMPSTWGIFGYLFAYLYVGEFNIKWLLFYPINTGASSFIAGVLWGVRNLLETKIYYYGKKIEQADISRSSSESTSKGND